jgi:hypothetical protein
MVTGTRSTRAEIVESEPAVDASEEIVTTTRRATTRHGPWIVAGVLGVVALVLAGLLIFAIRPEHNRHSSTAKAVGLTASEQRAMDAAAKQVLNILTYSRKTFEADFARTLAGVTGPLRSDLQREKPALKEQMTKGKFDLQGAVTSSAFEETRGNSSLILVTAQGYKVSAGGQRTLASTARFEVTMTSVDGKWLASDLRSVGLI